MPRKNNSFVELHGLFLKDGMEQFEIFMDPTRFLMEYHEGNLQNSNRHYRTDLLFLTCLQNKMHSTLEYFLNGYFIPCKTQWRYPLYDQFLASYIDIKGIHFLANFLTEKTGVHFRRLLGELSKISHSLREIEAKRVALIIAAYYTDFHEIIETCNLETTTIVSNHARTFNRDEYIKVDREYRQHLLDLSYYVNNRLHDLLDGFYLHGSLSTEDYIQGCSDCDTLAIIRENIAEDATKLIKLRREMFGLWQILYRIDPLQHHGPLFITNQDMQFYPQSYFPLVLFEYSTALMPSSREMVFQERRSELERHTIFWNAVYYFRWYYIKKVYPDNIYTLKGYLQFLLLLPTLYLQLEGKYYYKKFTFERIKDEVSSCNFAILYKASQFRTDNTYSRFLNWTIIRLLHGVYRYAPSHLWNTVFQYAVYTKLDEEMKRVFGTDLMEEAFAFSDQLLQKRYELLTRFDSA